MGDRDRFFCVLAGYPAISKIFDEANECYYPEKLEEYLGVASHGECIMANFFVSVWKHQNMDFDFIDAAATLDHVHKRVILEWMVSPYWP